MVADLGPDSDQGATSFDSKHGQVFLNQTYESEKYLWNSDFHPTAKNARNWGAWSFFAIWFGMAIQVESWALVSVGYDFGLNWFWSVMAVFIGNIIVLVPMFIQSHGGARYGIPETPLTRSRWGIYGNWLPSIIRGAIGAGWWGIDTWIIAEAVGAMYIVYTGGVQNLLTQVQNGSANPFTIATVFPALFWGIFVATIAIRLVILYFSPPKAGQRVLRIMAWIVPFVGFIGFLILFFNSMSSASWNITPILNIKTTVSGNAFLYAMIGLINANVAFWATMAISMPDYTRFAKSQYSQFWGQLTLPFLMLGVGALALVTTGASYVTYGTPVWDPVLLAAISLKGAIVFLVLFLLLLGVVIVNIFADTVGPGYDFANLYPKKLTWFRGVLIVVAIAVLIQSWSYYLNAQNYVENWLLNYGALLGGVEGIIIFDYAVIRRFRLELHDIFSHKGRFRYFMGVNPAAVIAFVVSLIIVYPPSLLFSVSSLPNLFPYQNWVYQNSWVSAILISGLVYLVLMIFWIIPKYQPDMKGSLRKGYQTDETKALFEGK